MKENRHIIIFMSFIQNNEFVQKSLSSMNCNHLLSKTEDLPSDRINLCVSYYNIDKKDYGLDHYSTQCVLKRVEEIKDILNNLIWNLFV